MMVLQRLFALYIPELCLRHITIATPTTRFHVLSGRVLHRHICGLKRIGMRPVCRILHIVVLSSLL